MVNKQYPAFVQSMLACTRSAAAAKQIAASTKKILLGIDIVTPHF